MRVEAEGQGLSTNGFSVVVSAEAILDSPELLVDLARSNSVSRVIVFGRVTACSERVDLTQFEVAEDLEQLFELLNQSGASDHILMLSSLARVDWQSGGALDNLLCNSDVVYWDHDYLEDGHRCKPVFKGAFSAEMLLDPELIPAWAVKKQYLCERLGSIVENSVYGISLGAFASTARVAHFDRVFTHHVNLTQTWREKNSPYAKYYHYDVDLTRPSDPLPDLYRSIPSDITVSVIIPTRNRLDLVLNCLKSIRRYQYDIDLEIIIVNNGSDEMDFLNWLDSSVSQEEVVRVDCDEPFNWSLLNNRAVEVAKGDILVFMNNDVEVRDRDWLFKLSASTFEPSAGAVGPLLLFPEGNIQHAGIVLGFGGYADHIYMGSPVPSVAEHTVFSHPLHRRQVSAVTGACMAIKRELFSKIGGFNESLTVAGDLELCLRLDSAGHRNLYLPAVEMLHLESATRSRGLPAEDMVILNEILPSFDPYYSAHLSLKSLTPLPVA
jgi:GT2 family glycosyltransferase